MSLIIIIILVIVSLIIISANFQMKKKSESTDLKVTNESIKPIRKLNFSVTGTNYTRRLEILTKIINDMKRDHTFSSESYMGLSNNEILKDGIRTYELSGKGFPNVYLEKDHMNKLNPYAMKVIVKDPSGDLHQIGYVPARVCKEIHELMQTYRMLVTSRIIGGLYKDIVIDDRGKEKLKEFTSDYGVHIHVSFWDDRENNLGD